MLFFIAGFPNNAFKKVIYFLEIKLLWPPLCLFKKIIFSHALSVSYCHNLAQALVPTAGQENLN